MAFENCELLLLLFSFYLNALPTKLSPSLLVLLTVQLIARTILNAIPQLLSLMIMATSPFRDDYLVAGHLVFVDTVMTSCFAHHSEPDFNTALFLSSFQYRSVTIVLNPVSIFLVSSSSSFRETSHLTRQDSSSDTLP